MTKTLLHTAKEESNMTLTGQVEEVEKTEVFVLHVGFERVERMMKDMSNGCCSHIDRNR